MGLGGEVKTSGGKRLCFASRRLAASRTDHVDPAWGGLIPDSQAMRSCQVLEETLSYKGTQ